MPGEVYAVTIDEHAFMDPQGNNFTGLATGYTISTRPLINFRKLKSYDGCTATTISPDCYKFFADSARYIDGSRYGAGVTVDKSNSIFVLGGHNATVLGHGQLNDVWKLVTYRGRNCGSSIRPQFSCTTDGQPPSSSNAVDSCALSGDFAYAGQTKARTEVWRSPSASGRQCMDSKGKPRSMVKDLLVEEVELCPCPSCHAAPPGLNAMTPMYNTIEDLNFTSMLPLVANNQELPLTCQDGYRPTGSFVCGFDTLDRGRFQTPYPTCEAMSCSTVPPATSDHHMSMLPPCNDSTVPNQQFPSGAKCKYECSIGYGTSSGAADGHWLCDKGTWKLDFDGSCSLLSCDITDGVAAWGQTTTWWCSGSDGAPGYLEGSENEVTIGMECDVPCPQNAGQTFKASCIMGSDGRPVFRADGTCPAVPTSPGVTSEAPVTASTTRAATPFDTTTASTTTLGPSKDSFLESSISITSDFGNETADSLKADEAWVIGFKTSMVSGLSILSGAGNGIINDDVSLLWVEMKPASSQRRLGGQFRRLATSQLDVDYRIYLPSSVADALRLAFSDETQRASMENQFSEKYAEAEKARTGMDIVVTVSQSANANVVAAKTPSAEEEEEEEGANAAAIAGGIIAGVVVFAIAISGYERWKKRRAAQKEGGSSSSI